ncbi:MAG TPA: DEAD/DEAH box helicase [Thermoplasmata archaeon]|nr:DEAD/DEAH box helicase [Thermoplasmata archaeon]
MSEPARPWPEMAPALRAALASRGLDAPTEIQRLGFPILSRSSADVLLIAPTGTGKTEAALVPLLDARLRDPGPPISILYVTPLRALNRDLEQRLVGLSRDVGLRAGVRHGDTPASERTRQVRQPPDLLLTTPETLTLLLSGSRVRLGLRDLRCVLVDEVHELFPSDRGAQLSVALERLDAFVGRPVRRVGLSATVSNPEEVARFLSPAPRRVVHKRATEPRRMTLEVRTGAADLDRLPEPLRGELRADAPYLRALLAVEEEVRSHASTLVFVNTRPTAEGLGARLRRLDPPIALAVHHGSLSRANREEAEQSFRDGQLRALVATSSLELGIDVGSVDRVVQFGSPHQASRLLQRIGRSGHRLDRTVSGVLLALDDDDLEEAAVIARRALAGEVEPTRWRTRNRLALAQQVVAALWADKEADVAALFAQLRHAACAADLNEREWEELLAYLESLRSLARRGPTLQRGRGTLERFYSTLSLIPEQKTYRLRDLGSRTLIGTLDERFVVSQLLAEPQLLFLLHGQTWRVVEFRDDELLVESVAQIGEEPRWVGEDLPVPYEAAQEIGAMRRTGALEPYPLLPPAREALARRLAAAQAEAGATDRRITLTPSGRVLAIGACFGNRTNTTLALALSGLLASRLGGRVEVLAIEPTWIVLGLPVALETAKLELQLHIPPEDLDGLVERLLPASPEYRYVFLNVARKFGVLPVGSDPRALRDLEPLIEASRTTPLGQEALEKTLHERCDLPHAREVLERIRDGSIEIRAAPTGALSELVLSRLRWREIPDTPPPTLLAAIRERLRAEPLSLVCLRCGFTRSTTAGTFTAAGSACKVCHGALSGVLSPRRSDEIDRIRSYARKKWTASQRSPAGRVRTPPRIEPLLRSAYTSAELLAHYGDRALLCLAARGVGPETAKRLLERPYRSENEMLTALTKAERQYARTRAFWE